MSEQVEMKENDESRPTDLGEMSRVQVCRSLEDVLLVDEIHELASIES